MDTEQLSMTKKTLVGVQFLFVAFGATVLVPLLIGIDPATALFTAGVGTFLFHFITKGKVPIFLGSSFAFIAPIIAATKQWGLPGTIAGLTSVSLVYFVMSALVKWQGKKLLDRIFPPVVIGPAIILIGLSLSGSAVGMAKTNWILAFASLITAILVLTFCKGLMKLVPIISGVIVGYVIAICMGEVDFSGVAAASWFSCPVSFDNITHFSWLHTAMISALHVPGSQNISAKFIIFKCIELHTIFSGTFFLFFCKQARSKSMLHDLN